MAACIEGGVDIVQLREKHIPEGQLARRAEVVQRVCSGLGVPFVLNDLPGLAAAIGADGVHVGQEDMAPTAARRIVGDRAILGLSTHDRHHWTPPSPLGPRDPPRSAASLVPERGCR